MYIHVSIIFIFIVMFMYSYCNVFCFLHIMYVLFSVFCFIVLFYVLSVCKCVLYFPPGVNPIAVNKISIYQYNYINIKDKMHIHGSFVAFASKYLLCQSNFGLTHPIGWDMVLLIKLPKETKGNKVGWVYKLRYSTFRWPCIVINWRSGDRALW